MRSSWQLNISAPRIKLEIGDEMGLLGHRGAESEWPCVPVKEIE